MLLGVASEPRYPPDTLYYLSISLSALEAYQCNFTSALQMQRMSTFTACLCTYSSEAGKAHTPNPNTSKLLHSHCLTPSQ